MSRAQYKTINLRRDLVDDIDAVLANGKFRVPLSRDEFVRHAVTILLLAVRDISKGDKPLQQVQQAAENLASYPTAQPAPLEETPRLKALLATRNSGQAWRLNFLHELIQQLAARQGGAASSSSIIAVGSAFGITQPEMEQSIEAALKVGSVYRKGDGFAPIPA